MEIAISNFVYWFIVDSSSLRMTNSSWMRRGHGQVTNCKFLRQVMSVNRLKLESWNFVHSYGTSRLRMTNYPQIGVVRVMWPIFKFWRPIISLERVKLGTSSLVCRLTLTSFSAHMIDYPERNMRRSRDLFKFWRITENISETDIVTMEH